MPTLPAPPSGVARIAFSGNVNDALWTNVMWVNTVGFGSADAADVTDLAHQLHTKFAARFIPLTCDSNALSQVDAVLYQSSGPLMSSYVAIVAGSIVGTKASAGDSVVGSWLIPSYYRGGKPRTYFSGQSATQLGDANSWLGSHITAYNTAMTGFISDVNAITTSHLSSVTLGTLRRFSGGSPLSPPVFYAYTGGHAHQGVGTIRRRNRYS